LISSKTKTIFNLILNAHVNVHVVVIAIAYAGMINFRKIVKELTNYLNAPF